MVYGSESLQSLKEKEMNAMERLENSMIRVRALINFYKQHPTTTLDIIGGMTTVTIDDLKILLDGLADRDISISEMPELVGLGQIHRETIEAREVLEKETKFDAWRRGYDDGYKGGRDRELRNIKIRINKIIEEMKEL